MFHFRGANFLPKPYSRDQAIAEVGVFLWKVSSDHHRTIHLSGSSLLSDWMLTLGLEMGPPYGGQQLSDQKARARLQQRSQDSGRFLTYFAPASRCLKSHQSLFENALELSVLGFIDRHQQSDSQDRSGMESVKTTKAIYIPHIRSKAWRHR